MGQPALSNPSPYQRLAGERPGSLNFMTSLGTILISFHTITSGDRPTAAPMAVQLYSLARLGSLLCQCERDMEVLHDRQRISRLCDAVAVRMYGRRRPHGVTGVIGSE